MPDCGILNIEGLTNEALVPKVIPTGAADETPERSGILPRSPPSKAAPVLCIGLLESQQSALLSGTSVVFPAGL